MDPLSVTASVIAIIGLAGQIIGRCQSYLSAVKEAHNDFCNILIEVGCVKCILETLKLRLHLSTCFPSIVAVNGPLQGCERALEALLNLFPADSGHPKKRKWNEPGTAYAELAWPFKQGKARKLLEDIARYKATIALILTTDVGQDVRDMKNEVENVAKTINSQELNSVLKDLVTTDPSPNHNRACQLHEEHTGQWLLRSPEYQEWLSGRTRFLWIHGIPGAGKTVLASFIIQHIQRFCNEPNLGASGHVYYYCYFGRNQDETCPLLRWTISQLCRQLNEIPNKLRSLLAAGTEPGYIDLLELLVMILKRFECVYVVIDALDESQSRDNILNLLHHLATDLSSDKLRILATSRQERDVQRTLAQLGGNISMSNDLVDEDIALFIESQLQSDRRLRFWPDSLKREVKQALIKGAKGMFRWVACQLEILSRTHSVPQIRKAILELPETIEKTYERILTNIAPSNRMIAHKTLQLVSNTQLERLEELAEAVVVNTDNCRFSVEDRLLDPMELLDICVCLIRVDDDNTVILAHYTVAEYLDSTRILNSPAAMFHTDVDDASYLITKIYLTYLLSVPRQQFLNAEAYFSLDEDSQVAYEDGMRECFPLITYAVLDLMFDLQRGITQLDLPLKSLVLRFLQPLSEHFQSWQAWRLVFDKRDGDRYFRFKFDTRSQFSLQLAYLCRLDLADIAEDLLQQNEYSSAFEQRLEPCNDLLHHFNHFRDAEGTPLQIAAMMNEANFVKLFIRYGANPNARHRSWTVLTSALRSMHRFTSYASVVELLLQAGANVNPAAVCKTPLQVAVERGHDIHVVKLLVAAGADVNAVGDPQAAFDDMSERRKGVSTRRDSETIESYCDTPLRLAKRILNSYKEVEPPARVAAICDMLRQKGAVSEHRTPRSFKQDDVKSV